MLAMVLMGRGIACEIAGNGQDAIDLVFRKGDTFDVIFMDQFMPVMVSNINQSLSILYNPHIFLWRPHAVLALRFIQWCDRV